LEAAAEGDEDALRDVGLGEADFFGASAVDIHGHIRVVEWLLDAGIGCAGNVADFIEHLLGEGAVAVEVRADDLDVNGGGEAEVEDLGDDVNGQHVEGDPGIFAIQHVAQALDVGRGGVVIGRELDLDVGVGGPMGAEVE
jgi:hypothetical protein